MKNPHGVEPTRYMKRKQTKRVIYCNHWFGPVFGDNDSNGISIYNECNRNKNCWIGNINSTFECNPEYMSSLFVNTAGQYEKNKFNVVNYEVFGIDNYKDYIHNSCKYPDIIMEYIETNNISEESLKQVSDDTELFNGLAAIGCKDSDIRLKISQLCLKNPSALLLDTQIVDQQYDDELREWCGDYKWKLLYRASEHDYTAKSFHECCDDKGPTLIIIKSTGNWIFGGYTTQSWSGDGIYNDMI